jgi:hypothetical protein
MRNDFAKCTSKERHEQTNIILKKKKKKKTNC